MKAADPKGSVTRRGVKEWAFLFATVDPQNRHQSQKKRMLSPSIEGGEAAHHLFMLCCSTPVLEASPSETLQQRSEGRRMQTNILHGMTALNFYTAIIY